MSRRIENWILRTSVLQVSGWVATIPVKSTVAQVMISLIGMIAPLSRGPRVLGRAACGSPALPGEPSFYRYPNAWRFWPPELILSARGQFTLRGVTKAPGAAQRALESNTSCPDLTGTFRCDHDNSRMVITQHLDGQIWNYTFQYPDDPSSNSVNVKPPDLKRLSSVLKK